VKLYLHPSNTPSWRGAQLKKHRDNFTFSIEPVARYSEHGNEPSGSIKDGKFLEQLNDSQLSRKALVRVLEKLYPLP
jgi:hypothetical protein